MVGEWVGRVSRASEKEVEYKVEFWHFLEKNALQMMIFLPYL